MATVNAGLLAIASTLVPLVTNATDDPGDPAVVAIVDASGITECTGTVIGRNFVLTAAHCLVPETRVGAHAVFGSSLASPSASIPVVAAVADPGYVPSMPGHDAAILVLGADAPVAPVPLATSAPAGGSTLRVVGWGVTFPDAGDSGTKRTGQSLVTLVSPGSFGAFPDRSQPCIGDSGGPGFATVAGAQVLAGITNTGDAACADGAIYTRVDVERASFIEPTLARFADGTVPAGQPCLFPQHCQGGASACVVAPDDANVSYCTESCSFSADCPAGMLCVSVDESGSQCRYPVPTPGAMGSSCSTDADCVDASCHAGTCAASCSSAAHACPAGFECESSNGVEYFCELLPISATTGSACALPGWAPSSPDACWMLPGLGLVAWARRRRRVAAESA
jgi:hypothetical protein